MKYLFIGIILFYVPLRFFALSLHAFQMQDYTGPLFPSDHALNSRIDHLLVHPRSNTYIASIGADTHLHPDFGTFYNGQPIGIPYNIVGPGQAMVPITFYYDDESDPGPYPIPSNPLIEGLNHWTDTYGGDRHVLIIQTGTNLLYESGNLWPDPDNTAWTGGAGAVFSLTSNTLRPETWTSSDAAGLPIFPLLIRYDEVQHGEITHAIRFTANQTQRAYVWPARHYASSITDPNVPPMGQRFRLKASVDISGYSPRIRVIFQAFKIYGIILADNGSNWFITGAHDDRWDDDELRALRDLHGSDFEAVDISPWVNHPDFDPNSAAVPGGATGNGPPTSSAQTMMNIVVFPNPAVRQNPTIRVFSNQMLSFKISIFDKTGQVVHSEMFPSAPTGVLNGKYYYDFVWSAPKASGVYYAVVTSKQGEKILNYRAKFSVLK